MVKKIIILIMSIFVLSGCADNFNSYFKRSANNKLIDSKGFKGGKRKPLYNRKYINTAKRNVAEENFDGDYEDDEDEMPSASRLNRQMYTEMLREDSGQRRKSGKLERYYGRDDGYPSLYNARKSAGQEAVREDELQKELAEIKSMLKEAKKDLAKYKCPAAGPAQGEPSQPEAAKPKTPHTNTPTAAGASAPSSSGKFMREEEDGDGKDGSKQINRV